MKLQRKHRLHGLYGPTQDFRRVNFLYSAKLGWFRLCMRYGFAVVWFLILHIKAFSVSYVFFLLQCSLLSYKSHKTQNKYFIVWMNHQNNHQINHSSSGFAICMVDIHWSPLAILSKTRFKNNLYLLASEYGTDSLFNVSRMEKNICILSYSKFSFNVFRMENNSYSEFWAQVHVEHLF